MLCACLPDELLKVSEVWDVPKLHTERPVRLRQELEAAAFNLGGWERV